MSLASELLEAQISNIDPDDHKRILARWDYLIAEAMSKAVAAAMSKAVAAERERCQTEIDGLLEANTRQMHMIWDRDDEIKRLRAAERERCAKIAETMYADNEDWEQDWNSCGELIAAAIRKGE